MDCPKISSQGILYLIKSKNLNNLNPNSFLKDNSTLINDQVIITLSQSDQLLNVTDELNFAEVDQVTKEGWNCLARSKLMINV